MLKLFSFNGVTEVFCFLNCFEGDVFSGLTTSAIDLFSIVLRFLVFCFSRARKFYVLSYPFFLRKIRELNRKLEEKADKDILWMSTSSKKPYDPCKKNACQIQSCLSGKIGNFMKIASHLKNLHILIIQKTIIKKLNVWKC